MAARISRDFGIDAELIKGSGGVFDVVVDGELIFSKHETGRFPADEEVLTRLRQKRG